MSKQELSDACSAGNEPTDSATTRPEYRSPKLTVVGTVHDLTLGIRNTGARDGAGRTGGAG